jgi:cell division ATPase FtsA
MRTGYPVYYGILPIGGEDVTKDISIGMQIEMKEAEKSQGRLCCLLTGQDAVMRRSMLDIKFLGGNNRGEIS